MDSRLSERPSPHPEEIERWQNRASLHVKSDKEDIHSLIDKTRPPVEINKRLVFINSASSMVARLLNVSVLVWMYEYLLARLSPEEFAIYPLVAAIIVFAPLFFSLLTGGLSRHVTAAYARGDMRQVTENISSILPPLAATGFGFMVLGLLFAWHIDEVLRIPVDRLWDARIMMALLILNFAFQTVLLPYGVGFQVTQRFVLLNIIHVTRDLLRLLLLLLLLIGVSPRVLWVVVATVTANIISVVMITWLSRRMIPQLRFELPLFRWQTTKRLISFGAWTTAGLLSSMIHTSAGVIVLNKFSTALDVTTYHLGLVFDRQVMAMTTLASATVQPALTAMHATGDHRRLGNAFLRGGRYALWATLFVGTPLIAFSTEFVALYVGDKFQQAATVIVLLMSTYPFTCSSIMFLNLAMATARVRPFFAGAIITQIIHLAVMMYLVGWCNMGAVGVALATFGTITLAQVLYFWPMGLRIAEVRFMRFFRETLLPGLLPATASLALWLTLERYQPPQTWSHLLGYVLSGATVYGFVLLTSCLQEHERRELVQAFKRVKTLATRK